MHWLIQLGEHRSLSKVVQSIKSLSAREVGRPTWQKGFYDHALRKDEDIKSVARYIIANPLRAGLVQTIGDYPHWDTVWVLVGNRDDGVAPTSLVRVTVNEVAGGATSCRNRAKISLLQGLLFNGKQPSVFANCVTVCHAGYIVCNCASFVRDSALLEFVGHQA